MAAVTTGFMLLLLLILLMLLLLLVQLLLAVPLPVITPGITKDALTLLQLLTVMLLFFKLFT